MAQLGFCGDSTGPFLLERAGIQYLLKVRGIQELDVEVIYRGRSLPFLHEVVDADKENFMQALQIPKEPPGFPEAEKITSEGALVQYKDPMMTRARATSRKK